MTFKIEKNIPFPVPKPDKIDDPFEEAASRMLVTDSVFFGRSTKLKGTEAWSGVLSKDVSCRDAGKLAGKLRSKGLYVRQMTIRDDNGVYLGQRVWRVRKPQEPYVKGKAQNGNGKTKTANLPA